MFSEPHCIRRNLTLLPLHYCHYDTLGTTDYPVTTCQYGHNYIQHHTSYIICISTSAGWGWWVPSGLQGRLSGSRDLIGSHVTISSMQVLLASDLFNFRFLPPSPHLVSLSTPPPPLLVSASASGNGLLSAHYKSPHVVTRIRL